MPSSYQRIRRRLQQPRAVVVPFPTTPAEGVPYPHPELIPELPKEASMLYEPLSIINDTCGFADVLRTESGVPVSEGGEPVSDYWMAPHPVSIRVEPEQLGPETATRRVSVEVYTDCDDPEAQLALFWGLMEWMEGFVEGPARMLDSLSYAVEEAPLIMAGSRAYITYWPPARAAGDVHHARIIVTMPIDRSTILWIDINFPLNEDLNLRTYVRS